MLWWQTLPLLLGAGGVHTKGATCALLLLLSLPTAASCTAASCTVSSILHCQLHPALLHSTLQPPSPCPLAAPDQHTSDREHAGHSRLDDHVGEEQHARREEHGGKAGKHERLGARHLQRVSQLGEVQQRAADVEHAKHQQA